MDGVFYVAVIPQTLSQGYTLTFVNSNEERFVSRVDTPVTFERNAIYDLGSFENMEWYMEPNPNPTTIPSVSIVKASFKEDEFNMVSEGSFEYFPDKPLNYRSPWVFDAETVAVPGHDGTPASSMNIVHGLLVPMAILISVAGRYLQGQIVNRAVSLGALLRSGNIFHIL